MTLYHLGRGACGELTQAMDYEWLVTNGIGGFASGTVCEINTRRYHGLLIAALAPPTARTLMVAAIDVAVAYASIEHRLATHEFGDGTVTPHGYLHLESFHLNQGMPVWRYAIADAVLEKRLLMRPGHNMTQVSFQVLRASEPLHVELAPLCSYRDYHSHGHGEWSPALLEIPDGCEIAAFPGAQPYRLICAGATFTPDPDWYWNFRHRLEGSRGLDDTEDLYRPGRFVLSLAPGEQATVVLSTGSETSPAFTDLRRKIERHAAALLDPLPAGSPSGVRQLALAADQFIVARQREGQAAGKTVIAGYPWFSDWGRDTMIALPGLTLATRRYEVAAAILRTFAAHVSDGMLPNRFPDGSATPEYNTVDATLWFFHAIDQYTRHSGDPTLAAELYPVLCDIIEWHRRGTRYGIRMDAVDGLLASGQHGAQLTWMDAKVGDWVVTPRIGKCVEVNALWYNALRVMEGLAGQLHKEHAAAGYRDAAERVKGNFPRFWNPPRGALFDVIDGPEGDFGQDGQRYDGRLRPNQILAVSLPHSPLDPARQKAVVDACARELLTSHGLRSLAPGEPGYVAHYTGGPRERDGAYHQGTVWAWLIGPFVDAHYRVYGDAATARSFLEPLILHLQNACLGSISEIFDAAPPFTARGCFAQAWSVAEVLRAWLDLDTHEAARQAHHEGTKHVKENP
ncbi:MAG: amylo-alpha-1,6-glucosidase [Xanthomonadales bacterium]|nr:amylo-alpha-1,6-glucosidase [Xanthomonadales bacterium]